MRKRHVCPKCQHNKILLVASVADELGGNTFPEPLHVAVIPDGMGFFGAKTAKAGKLSAVVCKQCGYTELYVADPASIPVDGTHVSEVTGPGSDAPYR